MSTPITTQSFNTDLLADRIDMVCNLAYNRFDSKSKKLFMQKKTDKRYIEVEQVRARPLANSTGEGTRRTHVGQQELWVTRAWVNYFESNILVTKQFKKFNKNKKVMAFIMAHAAEAALAHAMRRDKFCIDLINNYDSTTAPYSYGDNLALASASQKTGDGTTYSNISSAAASPNETALEAAQKVISTYTDTGGKPIDLMTFAILGGTDLQFDFARLVDSKMTLGSDFNDPNIVHTRKYLRGGDHTSPFYNNDSSFTIFTDLHEKSGNKSPGLVCFSAIDLETSKSTPDGVYAEEYNSISWFGATCGDKRHIYQYIRA